MITLEVAHLTRRFPSADYAAVDEISFCLEAGEILALVGPSGCGKTTTLRMIAGLERPDSGEIRLCGQVLASAGQFVPPEQRGIGMVFQDHALFPHLTVAENVAFGLRAKNKAWGHKAPHTHQDQCREKLPDIKSGDARTVVREMLQMVEMENLAARYPHELSGGERQRVALVRALATRPLLVLMDEPFSSLDADLRGEVRRQVRSILKALHTSVIFVTHDQEEALYMGDRLAVFQHGRLEQIGAPEHIFQAPASRFVARFMGDSDFLRGDAGRQGIQTEAGWLPQTLAVTTPTPVEVALRADDVDFELTGSGNAGGIQGNAGGIQGNAGGIQGNAGGIQGNAVITERFFRGAFNLYRLQLDSGQVLHAFKDHTVILPVGVRVQAYISAGHPLAVFQDERVLN